MDSKGKEESSAKGPKRVITSELVRRSFGAPSSSINFKSFTLNLSGLGAEGVAKGALVEYAALRKLNLSSNAIKKLADAPQLLSWLNLKGNKVKSTQRLKVLKKLEQLVTLILSHNRLSVVRAEDLESLAKLGALVLDHNKLTSETLRLPRTLRALNTLVLSHNSIASLDGDMLRSLPNLKKLSVSGNELTAMPDVSHNLFLAELRVANNKIERIEGSGSASVTLLDVSGNAIETARAMRGIASFPRLSNFAAKGNPADPSEADVLPLLKNATSLRVYNGKKRDVPMTFAEKARRKELRRKRNLISNKFDAPDPTKMRNKPCSCGSGIKYKLCCEKKAKSKAAKVVVPAEGTAVASKRQRREPSSHSRFTSRDAKEREANEVKTTPGGTAAASAPPDAAAVAEVSQVTGEEEVKASKKRRSVAAMLKQKRGAFSAW